MKKFLKIKQYVIFNRGRYAKHRRNYAIAGILLLGLTANFLGAQPPELTQPQPKRNEKEYPPGFYAGDPIPDHTVYLTFDDGPVDWTDEILDTLHANDVKATFFICANWWPGSTRKQNAFKKFKDTLTRMVEEGHVLGNHTAGHGSFEAMSAQKIERQLDLNQELLNEVLEEKAPKMTLIRPPFGHPWNYGTKPEEKVRVANVLKKKGFVMMWSKNFNSKDSREWVKGEWYERGSKIDVDKKEFRQKTHDIYNQIIKNLKGGGVVILFHDTHLTSVKVLPELIQKLKSLGYRFATLEDYVQWRWKASSGELMNIQ